MNEPRKVSLWLKIQIIYNIILELIKKNLGVTILVVGIFTLGYAIKNIEDQHGQKLAHDTLEGVQKTMGLECDARVLQSEKAATDRMASRDQLLAEQGSRLKDQGTLISMIAKRQEESINFTAVQMKSIKKSAADAKIAAKDTTVVVEKGVTDKDRQVINNKVAEKTK